MLDDIKDVLDEGSVDPLSDLASMTLQDIEEELRIGSEDFCIGCTQQQLLERKQRLVENYNILKQNDKIYEETRAQNAIVSGQLDDSELNWDDPLDTSLYPWPGDPDEKLELYTCPQIEQILRDESFCNGCTQTQKQILRDRLVIIFNRKCNQQIVREKICVEIIQYEFDNDKIKAESQPSIDKICDWMRSCPEIKIKIHSHASKENNNDQYNLELSQRRADNIKEAIIKCGINSSRIVAAIGHGVTQLLPGIPPSDKKNRRTEIEIVSGECKTEISFQEDCNGTTGGGGASSTSGTSGTGEGTAEGDPTAEIDTADDGIHRPQDRRTPDTDPSKVYVVIGDWGSGDSRQKEVAKCLNEYISAREGSTQNVNINMLNTLGPNDDGYVPTTLIHSPNDSNTSTIDGIQFKRGPISDSGILKRKPGIDTPIDVFSKLESIVIPNFQINTINRLAHFLAQCAHETDNWRSFFEYGSIERFNRLGYGKWHGRGWIHLTHEGNYQRFSDYLKSNLGYNDDIMQNPDLVAFKYAAEAGAAFFSGINPQKKDLRLLADKGASAGPEITTIVHGIPDTWPLRKKYFDLYYKLLTGTAGGEVLGILNTGDNFYDSGVSSTTDPQWKSKYEDIYTTKTKS
jgi:outer membrane protein OmpA-like peptidoglycan-associated protein/predicted chitinase